MKNKIIIFGIIIIFFLIIYNTTKKTKINLENIPRENFNFLWSKGLKNKDNYALTHTEKRTNKNILINQIKDKDIIWIRSCDLDSFGTLTKYLKDNVTLVNGDGDLSVPSELKKSTVNNILNCSKIKNWYAQNYDGSIEHPKLKTYPIGFDLHTSRESNESKVCEKINFLNQIKNSKKNDKVFCDLHLSQHNKFNNERKRVSEILKNNSSVNFLPFRINQKEIWKKYASHKFVISTFGIGLDCHRTWEALYLGAIVITKTSSLDSLFENLPVVIVKDWDEVNEENLQGWSKKYTHLIESKYIDKFFKYDYWLSR